MDGGTIKNVYTSGQLGIILRGNAEGDHITTEDGLLKGVIGVMLVSSENSSLKNSDIKGNALGVMLMDTNNTLITNISLYNNAFNFLAYNSKNIGVEGITTEYSLLGMAAYRVDNIMVNDSVVKDCISYISMQYSNYTVKNSRIVFDGDLGIINSFVQGVYINETVGIISEFSDGYVENTTFIGLEKAITNYYSSNLTVERSYFDNCLVAMKSNSLAEINNSTFVAVGICGRGSMEVNNSYFYIPDKDPSYLFIEGAHLGNVASTPPVSADIVYASGNVSGSYDKTVIIDGNSTVKNARFYRGVVFYGNSRITGDIGGRNYIMFVPKTVSLNITNASISGQKCVVLHSPSTNIKNVSMNGQFDFQVYNLMNVFMEGISSNAKVSIYAYNSTVVVANSSFNSYHTCIADASTINIVSSQYTWTYYRNSGKVYHSHWLTVNVLDSSGNYVGADVILNYDNSEHIYNTHSGRITVPAPYSKRGLWWEEHFNISVTAQNANYNYSWIELYMDSDKEITLMPEVVPEMTDIYILFAIAVLLCSLKNRKCLILLILIPPFLTYGVSGEEMQKIPPRSDMPALDIKEGDILLMGMGWLTPGAYSHTAIFHLTSPDGQWVLFESDEYGAHGSYFSKFLRESHLVALRVKGLCRPSMAQALSAMRERVGFSYDPVWVIRSFSAERQYCSGYAYLGLMTINVNLDPLNGAWGWCYGLGVAPTSLLLSEKVDVVWWL